MREGRDGHRYQHSGSRPNFFFDQNSDAWVTRHKSFHASRNPLSRAFPKASIRFTSRCAEVCILCHNYLSPWKKALELKKIRLHSQPGTNSTPSKRGHFLTHGCYQTAEIQFVAASIHQLAMFLHFKDLGPQWASPYRSGTKVTERIISEMQGKTNQIQSLDSQTMFVDMLQKSSSVQFNLNANLRLAHAGVDGKASAKRRRVALALKKNKAFISGFFSYPETFTNSCTSKGKLILMKKERGSCYSRDTCLHCVFSC